MREGRGKWRKKQILITLKESYCEWNIRRKRKREESNRRLNKPAHAYSLLSQKCSCSLTHRVGERGPYHMNIFPYIYTHTHTVYVDQVCNAGGFTLLWYIVCTIFIQAHVHAWRIFLLIGVYWWWPEIALGSLCAVCWAQIIVTVVVLIVDVISLSLSFRLLTHVHFPFPFPFFFLTLKTFYFAAFVVVQFSFLFCFVLFS